MPHGFIPVHSVVASKMQQQVTTPPISTVPTELESPRAKLVHVYLEASGGATVDDLNETLRMQKLDVLSVLRSLSEGGHVSTDGDRYVTTA